MTSRHFENQLSENPQTQEEKNLIINKIFEFSSIVQSRIDNLHSSSIYTGKCGVSLMLYRIAKFLESSTYSSSSSSHSLVANANLLTAADCYQQALEIANSKSIQFHPDRFTFVEGASGFLSLLCVLLSSVKPVDSVDSVDAALKSILEMEKRMRQTKYPKSECEILYGRCGYLMSIYFIRKELGLQSFGEDVVVKTLTDVVMEGINQSREFQRSNPQTNLFPPLLYYWHDSMYIGAAHGISGILHALCRFKSELPCIDEVMGWTTGHTEQLVIETAIFILTQLSHPSGNIKSSIGSERDQLVHWCHGAPGFLSLLICITEEFPNNEKIPKKAALERLGEIVWKRGLLKKGLGLCHGIGGNGLILLRLAKILQDSKWRNRANQFALFGIHNFDALRRVPDRPYSLFEGLAGFVWFLCDLLQPDCAKFPGMD